MIGEKKERIEKFGDWVRKFENVLNVSLRLIIEKDEKRIKKSGDEGRRNMRVMRMKGRNRVKEKNGERRIMKLKMIGVELKKEGSKEIELNIVEKRWRKRGNIRN